MTGNKIIKRMRELMYDNEQVPEFSSSKTQDAGLAFGKWKREQDYWIYTVKYKVKYEVTNQITIKNLK